MKRFFLLIVLFFCSSALYSQFSFDMVSLTGKVSSISSNDPIKATMVVVDKKGEIVLTTESDSKKGYYFITELSPGEMYSIRFSSPNFLKSAFEVVLPKTNKYEEYSRDFQLVPKKKNTMIPIKVSPFELNKSKLRVGANMFLKDIINVLKENPEVNFKISSYPDNAIDKTRNKELTTERSNSLKDFFVANGIEAKRIGIMANEVTDNLNPPPAVSGAKGKRYIGPVYIIIE